MSVKLCNFFTYDAKMPMINKAPKKEIEIMTLHRTEYINSFIGSERIKVIEKSKLVYSLQLTLLSQVNSLFCTFLSPDNAFFLFAVKATKLPRR